MAGGWGNVSRLALSKGQPGASRGPGRQQQGCLALPTAATDLLPGCLAPKTCLQDKPGAQALVPTEHTINFHDVCFQVGCRLGLGLVWARVGD